MPHRLAVTGPTGSGKSRLCRHLERLGARVIDADRAGHAVLEQPEVRERLVATFGDDILGDGGRIDREVLGRLVFAHPAQREKLDLLTHAALAAELDRRLAAAEATQAPLVVLEAAVYFLLPGPPRVDAVVAVVAAAPLRLARLEAMGLPPSQAAARVAAQAHLEPTWARADRIITNDGDEAALAAAAHDLFRAYSPGGKP